MEELRGCYDDVDFSEIKQTSLQLLDKVLDNLGAKFDLGTCSNVIGTAALRYNYRIMQTPWSSTYTRGYNHIVCMFLSDLRQ